VEAARKNLRYWVEKTIPKEHAERLARWRRRAGASGEEEESVKEPAVAGEEP